VVAEQNHGMVKPTAETHAVGNARNKAGVRRTSMLLLNGNLEQALQERTMVHEAAAHSYGAAAPLRES